VIVRRALGLLVVVLAAWAAPGHAAEFVDAVLGEVEGRIVTASDVALARALGLFGLAPTGEPIGPDVDGILTAWLVLAEARRLGIEVTPDDVAVAWAAAAARVGGPAALDAWLARAAVEPERARALMADDQRWRRFIDLRFREFAFVTPDEVAAALGPGTHTPEAEARMRTQLREAEARRRLAAWLAERADRMRRLPAAAPVPNPFPMP
jgi:hypothetical protein